MPEQIRSQSHQIQNTAPAPPGLPECALSPAGVQFRLLPSPLPVLQCMLNWKQPVEVIVKHCRKTHPLVVHPCCLLQIPFSGLLQEIPCSSLASSSPMLAAPHQLESLPADKPHRPCLLSCAMPACCSFHLLAGDLVVLEVVVQQVVQQVPLSLLIQPWHLPLTRVAQPCHLRWSGGSIGSSRG